MWYNLKNNVSHPVPEFEERQSKIEDGAFLEIEEDIAEYIYKIIDLCREKGVELIFYRAPYVSTENELKKLSHLDTICRENDVLFVDLEQEIEFDYTCDFIDYEHLSECGANRATAHLASYIMEAMGKSADFSVPVRENLLSDAWQKGCEADNVTENAGEYTLVSGTTHSGFRVYQTLFAEHLRGRELLGYFRTDESSASNLALRISCLDAEGEEVNFASASPDAEGVMLSLVVPVNAEEICVGIYADWFVEGGPQLGESVTLVSAELYQA